MVSDLDLQRVVARFAERKVEHYQSTDSTMLRAADAVDRGEAQAGDLFIADEQTAGRGRLGRSWHSPAGSGLYVTTILQGLSASSQPLITLALGLAVQETIDLVAGVRADLKWPNDVLIGDKKLAGILVQSHSGALLAGLGINLKKQEMPAELAAIATSLEAAGSRTIRRDDLLIGMLDTIDEWLAILREAGPAPIVEAFRTHSSYAYGREVIADVGGRQDAGTTAGIDDQGRLLLRLRDGRVVAVVNGPVRTV